MSKNISDSYYIKHLKAEIVKQKNNLSRPCPESTKDSIKRILKESFEKEDHNSKERLYAFFE